MDNIDGYHRYVFGQIANLFATMNPQDQISITSMDVEILPVAEKPDREYFEFEGGNVFSWSTKNLSESQRDSLYKMLADNIIKGILIPRQRLPDYYHNLVMAEAIRGNRNPSIIRYIEMEAK
jgi:hypothetical protein